MYRPTLEEFEGLRASYPVVPVWREVVADLETPVSAFMKVASEATAFLLESVEHGERWGRYSFVGIDPFLVMTSRDGSVSFEGDEAAAAREASAGSNSPLEAFRAVLESFKAPSIEGLPPFHAGAVGYIGYDAAGYLESLPQTTEDQTGAPEMVMIFARTMLVFDHLRQMMTIVTNVTKEDDYTAALERSDATVRKLGGPLTYVPMTHGSPPVSVPPSSMTQAEFEKAVLQAKDYIRAGDIFQVVLAHRMSLDLEADPFDVYRALRLVNPSPYMFFVSHPEVVVLGSSPEPLLKVEGTRLVQRPIAGTRPRGASEDEDAAIESGFVRDEKERAEHVMLVDLARNDIGRVAAYGTVEVEELMIVEKYSHVMHLVSQVAGRLRPDRSGLDALYASFPAGTVSGAPKIRAMEIIDELEPSRRGPYAGVVGYFDLSGNLDTCIALRTAYVTGGRIHIQAGAGIVADSDPVYEWNETLNKAKALLTAVALAERDFT